MHDVVIRGGTVVSGTGAAARTADVAVQDRLTQDPADFYGLGDRGAVAPGMRADTNVIDFDRLALRYPERFADLPAAAGRLIQRSDG